MWLVMAVLSAFFAGLTSILAKCGIKKTDSDVATAIRTVVVLLFSWVMVFVVGSESQIAEIAPKSLLFLILSGFATGASWICYFKALSMGDVNKVVPIDKLSTVFSVLLAILCFGETGHLPVKLGCTALLTVGIIMMVERKQEERKKIRRGWMFYALLSAVFAALTSILAKVGMGYCLFQGETEADCRDRQAGIMFYIPVGSCHRCILALLLLCDTERDCQCGGSG